MSIKNLGQYEENNCYAMGWGPKSRFSEDDDNMVQQILRDVQIPMVQNDQCEKLLQNAENESGQKLLGSDKVLFGSEFKLHKSFNCAGYELYIFY